MLSFKSFIKLLSLVLVVSFIFLPLEITQSATYFPRNLQQGSRGQDVLNLQKILNANPVTMVASSGPGSRGFETTYFGAATKRAVIKFQEFYASEILTPAGLTQGNGFVRALTRRKLESLADTAAGQLNLTASTNSANTSNPPANTTNSPTNTNTSSSQIKGPPHIDSISPDPLKMGDKIQIKGKNFLEKNDIIISLELPDKFKDIRSASSTLIEFDFKNSIQDQLKEKFSSFEDDDIRQAIIDKIKEGLKKDNQMPDGTLHGTLQVSNKNGLSNEAQIRIDIFHGL